MSGHQPLLPEYEVQEPSGLPIYYGDGDDTTPIYHSEAEGEIPNKPMRLAFSQIDGQTSIVVSNADTSAPLYNIQLDDNLAAWVNMSPTAILANPDNLPPFETTAPAFTTIQFGTHALLNSFDPYRHDIRRWGYKITIPDSNNNGSNLSSNFPLDEGTNLYAVGLFETTKTNH
ncbi:hypothetical protein BDR26DRAFT_314267 [Obelidium mucronatum]|nr:hypothetical protein BDR26DRAFT_314267 [Obelidium mucronatum]